MKKSITLVALAFGVTSAFAQDLTSKKGEPFLPEADEWSISVDATPFLNYMGNFFGKGGPASGPGSNMAPTWDHYSLNQSITGKMFKDANTAYRATIRLGIDNVKNRVAVSEHVAPAAALTEPLAETSGQLYDQRKASTRNIVLGVGMEKRRGKTRLQGVYGADLLIWGGNTKESYKYGNTLTQVNDDPLTGFNENLDADGLAAYTTDWSTYSNATTGVVAGDYATNVSTTLNGYTNVDAARVLKRKTAGSIGVGVRAFIGVEYFIVPKISIGGEFGWGVGFQVNTKDKATWDAEGTGTAVGATQAAAEIKTKDSVSNGSQFVIDTDRNAINSANYNLMGGSGTIRLNFHF